MMICYSGLLFWATLYKVLKTYTSIVEHATLMNKKLYSNLKTSIFY